MEKEAETPNYLQNLQASETRYRRLFETAQDGILILNAETGQIDDVNPYMIDMLRYSREEFLGKKLWEVSPFKDTALNRAAFEKLQYKGYIRYKDLPLETKEGSPIAVEFVSNVYKSNGDKVIQCNIRNITERKQAEAALLDAHWRLKSIIEGTQVGTWSWNIQNGEMTVNDIWAHIIGYTHNELCPISIKTWETFAHPDDLKTSAELLARHFADEIPYYECECRMKHRDGRWVWVYDRGKVVTWDTDGKPLMIMGTHTDITARKLAEEENRNLGERLQRAEKMEALGLLAGGVAHDLNNVLGIVVGYAELMANDIDESNAMREDLINIKDAGNRAAAIVQDLLTLARRGVAGRKVLNLNGLILDFNKSPEMKKLLSYHHFMQVKIDLESDLLNISASSVHLEKTLFNLISNAAEAMPKGGDLTIKTANQYLDKPVHGYDHIREGDYVVLSVIDKGEGIPEQDLKRIFEPFYTKKVMGRSGTGLGLAVAWGTVKDHQGYIDVQSEEGKGTVFTLYFPVAREDITAETSSVMISQYMGQGESILVVDDVKGQRELAAAMLKKLNYQVAHVTSGKEAVIYLKKHKVDLLILDMIMEPGMDGLDTYKNVLAIYPTQKAIIVSGFSETERVNEAQALGAGAYVKKPYIIEKLGLAVKKELDKSA